MKHTIDLDELLQMCSDAKAKEYMKEAIDCYKVGAYRSSIVSTWIAVVYNVIDKLRELGIAGDGQAAAQVKKFEEITTNRDIDEALKFERTILASIQNPYEFITGQEVIELNRLFEDRNRCAHPNLSREEEIFSPTPEQARMHIRNAVEILLSRPPVQGKAALTFLQGQIDSEYFPTDDEAAFSALKISPVYRAKKNLIKGFMLSAITSCLKEELTHKKRMQRIVAMKAVLKLHPNVAEEIVKSSFDTICQKLNDDQLKHLVELLCQFSDLQSWVSQQTLNRLKSYVSEMPSDDVPYSLHFAYRMEALNQEAKARYARVGYNELKRSVTYLQKHANGIPAHLIDMAIITYAAAGNYNEANLFAMELIRPSIRHASKEQLLSIIKASKNSQVRESHEFSSIAYEIAQQGKIAKPELRMAFQENSIDRAYEYLWN